jgi:hypothetical protein
MAEYTMIGTRPASGTGALCGPSFALPLEASATDPTPGVALQLLLAAVAADVLAATGDAAVALHLDVGDVTVRVQVARGWSDALMLTYELRISATVPEARLAQLHAELRRSAHLVRVIGPALQLTGSIRRGPPRLAG